MPSFHNIDKHKGQPWWPQVQLEYQMGRWLFIGKVLPKEYQFRHRVWCAKFESDPTPWPTINREAIAPIRQKIKESLGTGDRGTVTFEGEGIDLKFSGTTGIATIGSSKADAPTDHAAIFGVVMGRYHEYQRGLTVQEIASSGICGEDWDDKDIYEMADLLVLAPRPTVAFILKDVPQTLELFLWHLGLAAIGLFDYSRPNHLHDIIQGMTWPRNAQTLATVSENATAPLHPWSHPSAILIWCEKYLAAVDDIRRYRHAMKHKFSDGSTDSYELSFYSEVAQRVAKNLAATISRAANEMGWNSLPLLRYTTQIITRECTCKKCGSPAFDVRTWLDRIAIEAKHLVAASKGKPANIPVPLRAQTRQGLRTLMKAKDFVAKSTKPVTAEEIAGHICREGGHVRTRIIPKLKEMFGMTNDGHGYYFPSDVKAI